MTNEQYSLSCGLSCREWFISVYVSFVPAPTKATDNADPKIGHRKLGDPKDGDPDDHTPAPGDPDYDESGSKNLIAEAKNETELTGTNDGAEALPLYMVVTVSVVPIVLIIIGAAACALLMRLRRKKETARELEKNNVNNEARTTPKEAVGQPNSTRSKETLLKNGLGAEDKKGNRPAKDQGQKESKRKASKVSK